jgi:hypothetical protein
MLLRRLGIRAGGVVALSFSLYVYTESNGL